MDTNMALNDLAIKRTKPGPKIIKLSDGHGLQLWVTPDGAKRWRMAYRFGGVQKTLAIGVYPAIGLKEARQAREDARRSLSKGQDLSQTKREATAAQAEKGADIFDAIAAELAEKKRREGKAPVTLKKFEWLLGFARPAIGARPIGEISARDVLGVLKEVEARGVYETARKLCTAIGDVFRYAIATARAASW
jgi:hypothetical protein